MILILRSSRQRFARACFVAAVGLFASAAPAGQPPPDYGLDWITIGDPGNRGTYPDEAPGLPAGVSIGSVPYRFRITRTEITAGQWYEFVQAYAPYYQGSTVNSAFSGQHIIFLAGSWTLVGPPDAPTRMSWEYAARYCNWLQAGRDPNAPQSDFESGAYDTSTFTQNPDGSWNHQAERSPGALFFIPNLDEWTKSSHWDPNNDRYWYRLGGQDAPLISGFPQNGGETNAGPNVPVDFPMPVGSYPHVMSPWGLLDTSGGQEEWTETVAGQNQSRLRRGSIAGDPFYQLNDAIDFPASGGVFGAIAGLRLASAVPSPGGASALLGFAGCLFITRRRPCPRRQFSSQPPPDRPDRWRCRRGRTGLPAIGGSVPY